MITLGITDGITGGAAIVHDGRIVAAVNEERLVRKKMAYGFPRCSIQAVFRLSGLGPSDIDNVAVATTRTYFQNEVRPWDGWFEARQNGSLRARAFAAASTLGSYRDMFPGLEDMYYQLRRPLFAARRRKVRAILEADFNISAGVKFIDHHHAHAASAYFTSGLDRALVITMDGGGDGLSSSVYEAAGGKLRKLAQTSSYNSLGNYYSYVTHICGFKAQKHEGKITGLAAHGEPRHVEVLKEFIDYRDNEIINVGKVVFLGAIEALRKRLPVDCRIQDLASSIQLHSEAIAARYVSHWLEKTGCRNIAIAGGVFANVRINQRIRELPGVESVFVHPGMDDGGLAVGAALAVNHGTALRPCIENVYFGPEYSRVDIARALETSGLSATEEMEIESSTAKLLAKGYVVARFNGRMEYGPRALGNRSILYQPTDRSVNDWLNKNLKRTEFMPFAPSTLYESAAQCYRNLSGGQDSARFMTMTFDCTEWMARHCPGVVHIDGTARPQLVKEEQNPSFHRVIAEFEKLTGLNSVINTSFNVHEEPIVCSPQDAIRAFLESNLDYLAIGPFLVRNPKPLSHPLKPALRA